VLASWRGKARNLTIDQNLKELPSSNLKKKIASVDEGYIKVTPLNKIKCLDIPRRS
jgi:hypothetical protein